jgi:hypothetical protein
VYRWEEPFIDRVTEIRTAELRIVRNAANIVAVGFSLILLSLPSLMPLVVFADWVSTCWGANDERVLVGGDSVIGD